MTFQAASIIGIT